ncbi:YihY/virulence factor BrkB family protein [Loigolactobacillus binensis]|uniref:YihY/virulence factor BrkB family protein n=1 Tax=Loigolactobacillus binensis TaxID=2559922 RepID=A0ABW3EEJ9_9LACO|nr:YihY/virulence factor BrkB family protein [Loigolactobacillus binensis]
MAKSKARQLLPMNRRQRRWRFVYLLIAQLKTSGINDAAVVVAFWELLSLFPLIIFAGNVVPLLHIDGQNILDYAVTAIPPTIAKQILPIAEHFMPKGNSNSSLLSIGAIGTWWAGSRGVNALKRMMDRTYGVLGQQNPILLRAISLLMTVLLAIALVMIVVIFSFGQQVLDWVTPLLNIPVSLPHLFSTLKWPVTSTVVFLMLVLIYYLLPNVKLRLRSVLPGALLTTIGWLLLSQLFSLYVRYFAQTVLSYGTIGFFIVLLLWLDFSAWIMMFGAMINVVFQYTFFGEVERNNGRMQHLHSRKKTETANESKNTV